MKKEPTKEELQKKIEELNFQLKELQEECYVYKCIFDDLPFGIQVFDKNGISLKYNPKQKEYLGLPDMRTGIGKFNVLTDPYSIKIGSNLLFQKAYKGEKLQHEYEFPLGIPENKWETRKDSRIFQETIFPLKQDNKINFVISVINDITDLTNAHKALKESEQRLQAIFKQDKSVKLIIDPHTGKIEDANPAATLYYGYSYEEITKKTIYDINLLSTEEVKADMLNAEQKNKDYFTFKHKLANGEIRDVEVYSSPIQYKNTTLLFSVVRDVTEKNKMAHELKRSEQTLKEAQETAHIGHWELDIKNNKLYWSDEVYRIFGLKPQEFEATYEVFLNHIHPEDRDFVAQAYAKSVEKHTNYDITHRVLMKNGQIKFVKEKCNTTYNEQNQAVFSIGTVADITEHVEKENIIKSQKENLEKLNATKTKLFSIIAHDLKAPFNGILGFSELTLEDLKKEDFTNINRYITIIHQAAKQSIDLLSNLLAWSRLQTKQISFHPESIELHKLVNNTLFFLNAGINAKTLIINNTIDPNLQIQADSFMLETIFRNLISNAIKFSYAKGEIRICATQKETEILISVRDSGTGIRKEHLPFVFQGDSSLSTLGTNAEQGTGLGLILCKEFVEHHGGKIWVESEERKGSRFIFSLPQSL